MTPLSLLYLDLRPLLQSARSGVNERVWRRIVAFNRSDPRVLSPSRELHLAMVNKGGYAVIGDKTMFEVAMSKECGLEMTKETFMPIEYGVGLQRRSAYKAIFSAE